jgi:hypothetical protein
MAQRYLFECKQCGRRTPISEAQAGQVIVCNSCGDSQKLGTLREIRALQTETAARASGEPQARRAAQWSPLGRALFAMGSFALIAGVAIAGYQILQASSLDTERPEARLEARRADWLRGLSPAGVLREWERRSDPALVETWSPHPYLQARRIARRHYATAIIGGVMALAGAGMLFGSFLSRKSAGRPMPQRRHD